VAAFVNPQWRGDFQLLGRLLGLALWHQVTLDLPVHPYICELLLQDEGTLAAPSLEEDCAQLEKIDAELYKHKVWWLLKSDIADLGFEMSFTDTLPSEDLMSAAPPCASSSSMDLLQPLPEVVSQADILPGECKDENAQLASITRATQVELVPGGSSLTVTEENKEQFVKALLDWRLRGSLRPALGAMLQGLRAAMPSAVLAEARRMLTPWEVHALLAGSRDIDSVDWERNTRTVGGLQKHTREVRWFWQIVHQWAKEKRQDRLQDLLQFATGSRRVPVGGFAQLVGFNGGKHLFTLAKGVHLSAKSLPMSHACICTVDLPPWDNFEDAQRKLQAAAEVGKARFDEGGRGG